MKILISPHSDDATLFATYTILREKPLVVTVTHATMQGGNGYERAMEDYKAMKILGVPIMFLGIDEDKLTGSLLDNSLHAMLVEEDLLDCIYLPAYEEGGNPQHNLINKVIDDIASLGIERKFYKTYTGLEDRTIGEEVIPTPEELELKRKALACYRTQIENPNTRHYFLTTREYI